MLRGRWIARINCFKIHNTPRSRAESAKPCLKQLSSNYSKHCGYDRRCFPPCSFINRFTEGADETLHDVLLPQFPFRTNEVSLSYASYESTKVAPSKPPVFVLHGLFGSKNNWKSLSKAMVNTTGRKVVASSLHMALSNHRRILMLSTPQESFRVLRCYHYSIIR